MIGLIVTPGYTVLSSGGISIEMIWRSESDISAEGEIPTAGDEREIRMMRKAMIPNMIPERQE